MADTNKPNIVRSDEDEVVFRNYTRQRLVDAFEIVKPDNWKDPIEATVPSDADLDLIDAAVVFFVGSSINWEENKDGTYTVCAAGYYADVGA